jgi:hypothetical protein
MDMVIPKPISFLEIRQVIDKETEWWRVRPMKNVTPAELFSSRKSAE